MSSTAVPRLLGAALAAAGRGWPVFPLVPEGKRPAIAGWPQAATTDVDVLAAWWRRAPFNVGIACGPAGLLVVDLDGAGVGRAVFADLAEQAGAVLEGTFTVRTPSGGEHRYYTVPGGQPAPSTVGTVGRYVDTRGSGGYIVAAGSSRRIGGVEQYYRLIDSCPPQPVPGWLAVLLQPPVPHPRTAAVLVGDRQRAGYGAAALVGEVRRVRTAGIGLRNAVLFDAAVRLGTLVAAGVLDEQDVRAELAAASSIHVGIDGFTAAEAERAIGNGLRYGLQRPRQLDAG